MKKLAPVMFGYNQKAHHLYINNNKPISIMVLLNTKSYNGQYWGKTQHESQEAAIAYMAKNHGPHSDCFLTNSLWIEGEQGNIVLNPKETKKAIRKASGQK